MSYKHSVGILVIGVVAVAGVTLGAELLAQGNQADESSARMIGSDQYRMEAGQTLQMQQEMMRARDEVWRNLSGPQREEYLAQVRARLEQQVAMDSVIEEPKLSSAAYTCDQGFRYSDREPYLDTPFHDWEFVALNFWDGPIKKSCVGVYAGYVPADPERGALAIYGDFENSSQYQVYLTPTATGPVRILSEKNGVLTLESMGGSFSKNLTAPRADGSTSVRVDTHGGETYVFDLATKSYH